MDDFLDQIIMWPDTDTTGHSSWSESGTDKTNGLDAGSVEVLEGTEKGIISSDIVIGCLATHGPPSDVGYILTGGNSSCSISNGIFTGETPLHQEPSCNDSVPSWHEKPHFSSQEVMESSLMAKSLGMHESMLRGKLQDFDMQAEFLRDDSNIVEKRCFGERLQQPENLPAASMNLSQHLEADSMKHFTNQYFVSELQPPPAPAAAGCNGAAKSRVRARRGQATDPHSIAERLRREKIAERMKSLQELVPNSNKTDKASMLDEIIEYVKFLQLQVKVLSMSRLGAAGAVVPLITDVQSEGSSSLLLSPSVGQRVDLLESPDNIAVEQEVVKLMESNVTSAMQYLQTKGLCLMPLALASAISGGKASSKLFPVDRKNSITTHGVLSSNSSSPSAGTQTMSSSSESTTKDNVFRNESVEVVVNNGCNGAVVIQEEEMQKSTGNIRELKLKV